LGDLIILISFAIFDKQKFSFYMCKCKLKTNHILYWDKFILFSSRIKKSLGNMDTKNKFHIEKK
jgi:hypothetical protein